MKTIADRRFFILAAFVLALTCQTFAGTLTVTKVADSNDGVCDADCSLREAVSAAQANDSVNFLPELRNSVLMLGGEEIVINKYITINGLGAKSLTISGNLTSRIFLVETGAALTLTDMTLTQGNGVSKRFRSGDGGAVCAQPESSLRIDRVNLYDNHALLNGGAVEVWEGIHRITNSSLTNNSAPTGTALTNLQYNRLYMSNVTVSGNFDSDGEGGAGALANWHGSIYMRNSTVVNNVGGSGGGIFTNGGQVIIGNSIVAGNSAQPGAGADIFFIYFGVESKGGNLIGNPETTPATLFTRPGDVINAVPLLAPLGFYGGEIRVHALGIGSPARDTGINTLAIDLFDNSLLTTDARGSGFARIVNNAVDKGALESPLNANISGRVAAAGGRGIANATVKLIGQTGEVRTSRTNAFGYYRFNDVPVGQTYNSTVSSKGNTFAPQSLDVVDQITDFNFAAIN